MYDKKKKEAEKEESTVEMIADHPLEIRLKLIGKGLDRSRKQSNYGRTARGRRF